MSNGHAILAPSAFERTVPCPGSVGLSIPYLDLPRTDEQIEGDMAHWIALHVAAGRVFTVGELIQPWNLPATQEMLFGAELWAAVVGTNGTAEKSVNISRIHTHCWGTPDNRQLSAELKNGLRILDVYDYKFGHKYVEVFENFQVLAYAVGVLDELGLYDADIWVRLTIVQPRSYHRTGPVRVYEIRADQLRALANIIHTSAWQAVDESGKPRPNAPTKAGPHCEHCPARHECVTLQRAGLSIIEATGTADVANLPPDALGFELAYVQRSIKLLEARETGLAAQAEALLRSGKRVPGYMMEPKTAREAWLPNTSVDEVAALGDMIGVDLRKSADLITPTQARTALKARKIEPTIIDQYAKRPQGAMALVRDTNIEARKAFGGTSK